MRHELNDYTLEKTKDTALLEIKSICFKYLQDKKNISDITDEQIIMCYNILLNEYDSIYELKEGLKIKTYFSPFYEIYSNLDEMISRDNLLQKTEKISFIELTKEINYLEDILAFCYGVFHKIIKEKKIDIIVNL